MRLSEPHRAAAAKQRKLQLIAHFVEEGRVGVWLVPVAIVRDTAYGLITDDRADKYAPA